MRLRNLAAQALVSGPGTPSPACTGPRCERVLLKTTPLSVLTIDPKTLLVLLAGGKKLHRILRSGCLRASWCDSLQAARADPEVLVGGSGLGRLHLAKEGYLRFSEEIGLQLPMQPAAAAQKADPMQKTAAWA